MSFDALVDRAVLGACAVLLMLGVAAVWSATSAIKRLAALGLALLGAIAAAAAMGAPYGAVTAGVAAAFTYMIVGVSIAVRMQEEYGGVETGEADAADNLTEPAEPKA